MIMNKNINPINYALITIVNVYWRVIY